MRGPAPGRRLPAHRSATSRLGSHGRRRMGRGRGEAAVMPVAFHWMFPFELLEAAAAPRCAVPPAASRAAGAGAALSNSAATLVFGSAGNGARGVSRPSSSSAWARSIRRRTIPVAPTSLTVPAISLSTPRSSARRPTRSRKRNSLMSITLGGDCSRVREISASNSSTVFRSSSPISLSPTRPARPHCEPRRAAQLAGVLSSLYSVRVQARWAQTPTGVRAAGRSVGELGSTCINCIILGRCRSGFPCARHQSVGYLAKSSMGGAT